MGRATTQIEAYTDGLPSDTDDRTTRTTYDGLNRVVTLTADLPAGQADQTTEYAESAGLAPREESCYAVTAAPCSRRHLETPHGPYEPPEPDRSL